MDAFSFVFSLFGLLLGLSLTEVLSGFGRALKVRHKIRIGYLTPLLGMFLMLNLASFWMDAWRFRDVIPPSSPALLVGLILTSVYYLGASLVFPDDMEEWPDLDAYYLRHKAQVLVAILIADRMDAFLVNTLRDHSFSGRDLATMLIGVAVLSLPIFLKGKRANLVVLAILVGLGVLTMGSAIGDQAASQTALAR